MCSSIKHPYLPHGWLLEIARVSQKPKFLKEVMKQTLEFQEGGGEGVQTKYLPWIFSGITQLSLSLDGCHLDLIHSSP